MAERTRRHRRALFVPSCIAAVLLTGCAGGDDPADDRCTEIEAQALDRLEHATTAAISDEEQEFEQLTAINLALDNPECFSAEAVAAARARKEQLLGEAANTP